MLPHICNHAHCIDHWYNYTGNEESQCPSVPTTTNTTRNITEHSNFFESFSITAQAEFSILSWCFTDADNHTTCCICDNREAGNCSHKDWKLKSEYGTGCSYEYKCIIEIENVAKEKYDGGVLQGRSYIFGSPQFDKIVIEIYIHVISSNKNTNIRIIYPVLGCAAIVSLIIGGAVVIIACALKKRSNVKFITWGHSGYQEIPSVGKAVVISATQVQ